MTASLVSNSGRVMLRCPSCGTSEQAAAEALADEPVIVCRNCGDTWPVGPAGAKSPRPERIAASRYPVVLSDERLVDAVRRPLVSYTDSAVEDAWMAKLQADMPRAVPSRRQPGTMIATALCAAFLAAFVLGRERAVASVPDLAGLYAALGLPVNLQGLAISNVEALREPDGSAVVRGFIVNVGDVARPVPPVKVAYLQAGNIVAGQTEFEPPERIIAAGGAAAFEYIVPAIPSAASEVTVRFRAEADSSAARLAASAGL